MADFVFHDPSGRRARRIGLAIGLILSFIAAIGAGFAVTLAMAPHLPDVRLKDPRVLSALHQETRAQAPHSPHTGPACPGPAY